MKNRNVKLICAWCDTVLGGADSAPVSHGICPDCYEQVEASIVPLRLRGHVDATSAADSDVDEDAETVAMSRSSISRRHFA